MREKMERKVLARTEDAHEHRVLRLVKGIQALRKSSWVHDQEKQRIFIEQVSPTDRAARIAQKLGLHQTAFSRILAQLTGGETKMNTELVTCMQEALRRVRAHTAGPLGQEESIDIITPEESTQMVAWAKDEIRQIGPNTKMAQFLFDPEKRAYFLNDPDIAAARVADRVGISREVFHRQVEELTLSPYLQGGRDTMREAMRELEREGYFNETPEEKEETAPKAEGRGEYTVRGAYKRIRRLLLSGQPEGKDDKPMLPLIFFVRESGADRGLTIRLELVPDTYLHAGPVQRKLNAEGNMMREHLFRYLQMMVERLKDGRDPELEKVMKERGPHTLRIVLMDVSKDQLGRPRRGRRKDQIAEYSVERVS